MCDHSQINLCTVLCDMLEDIIIIRCSFYQFQTIIINGTDDCFK